MDSSLGTSRSNGAPERKISGQLDLSSIGYELIASFDPVAQKHLLSGNYQKFFIAIVPSINEQDIPQQVLDILPYFGYLQDNAIHRRVQDFYVNNMENPEYVDLNALTESRYNYIMNAGFGSRFLPPEWIEEVCDDGSAAIYAKQSAQGKNLQPFLFTLRNLSAHKIEVEKSVFVHQHTSGQLVHLATIVNDFLTNMPFWRPGPLPSSCAVYALYYIGTKALYKGKVKASLDVPIYVGRSFGDATAQLSVLKHKQSNLQLTDFALRLILVDNRHYVRTLQGMLIERYDPLWNNKQIGLHFGKISKDQDDSLWIGYHVKQHPKALQIVDNGIAEIIVGESGESKCLQQ